MSAVDAFLHISRLIFKWFFIILGALIALALIVWAGMSFYSFHTYGRHVENVHFLVEHDVSKCTTKDYPIRVLIGNNSERTIEYVSFRLTARRPGRSTDLAHYHSYSDDHVMEPQSGSVTCWRVPEFKEPVFDDPKTLEWSIATKNIRFKD